MSDYNWSDIDPDTESGTDLSNRMNSWRAALESTHKGSTAPSNAVSGKLWMDDSGGTTWLLKLYDGTDWISLLSIDTTANTATPLNLAITQSDVAAGANFVFANQSVTITAGHPENPNDAAEHTGGAYTPNMALSNIINITMSNNMGLEPPADNGTMVIRVKNNGTITAFTYPNLTLLSGAYDLTDGVTNVLGLLTVPDATFLMISQDA